MELNFLTMGADTAPILQSMMTDYYLASDPDSGEAAAAVYAQLLLELVESKVMDIRLARLDGNNVGFILFAKDKKGTDFTEIPGYGTIMDVSVVPEYRNRGIGTALVHTAEASLAEQSVSGYYICTYEKAAEFWAKLGYQDSGEEGTNGLPLCVKK